MQLLLKEAFQSDDKLLLLLSLEQDKDGNTFLIATRQKHETILMQIDKNGAIVRSLSRGDQLGTSKDRILLNPKTLEERSNE